jgi:hypothetical protein
VFLRQGSREIHIDARPSDAIALAIGNRVPIYVSRQVLERAGVKPETPPSEPASPPEKLLKDIFESGKEEKTL